MTARVPRILLIDDLRSFVDGREAQAARTSSAGVELLERHRSDRLDELWLDHDLGQNDTIWPVVEVLERAAFNGQPFDVGAVIIHSANPAGAAKMAQALRYWRYPVRTAPGTEDVGYVDRSSPARPNDPDVPALCPACGAGPSQSTDPQHMLRSVCYCGHPRYYDPKHVDGTCPCLPSPVDHGASG
jgi:hypothetical protein